ncbi:DUF58 domain-containing protein [Bifidobacterium pseudolongum]|nr:DUF58 domain-containing protein [Bifidobacterium pseudolongum]
MSPLGWATIACAAICLTLFATLGWHEMLAAGLVCVAMLLAALVLSLGNTSFHASIDVSQRRVSVHDTVHVQVTVENPGATPTASARADLPMGDEHERFGIPMLASRQSKRTTVSFTAIQRAVLPIGPLMIRKGDPFGLMRHERRLAERVTVYIHPTVVALGMLHAGIPRDLEGNPTGDIVDDDLDFYGLREYEPGDDVRNVHWLSSAKTGTLMIRQFEATRRTDTSLSLGVNPDDYVDAGEFELAVSAHASIGVQALREDRPLYAHVGATHTNPANPMVFLDECSAVEPRLGDERNLAQGALAFTPDASLYCFTVGSLKPLDDIRRMASTLPQSARVVVVQTAPGATRGLRDFGDFTLATIGELNDLPLVMGAMR